MVRGRTAALSAIAALVLSVACTPPGTNHLELRSPIRLDGRTVEVNVECADAVTAEVENGAGIDGIPLVTVTGDPTFGRCRVPVRLDLPEGTVAIEDAATGMVLELPRSAS